MGQITNFNLIVIKIDMSFAVNFIRIFVYNEIKI